VDIWQWEMQYLDTILHVRNTLPSDTLYVEANVPQISCIQSIGVSVQNASGSNISDGAIFLTIDGGTPPYNFLWSNNDTQQNLITVLPDIYSVQVSSSDSICPVFYLCAKISTIDDSTNYYLDTIYTQVVDTCFNFSIEYYYVSDVLTIGDTTIVVWVFVGGGQVATLATSYYTSSNGEFIAQLSINCAKNTTFYYYKVYVTGINVEIQHCQFGGCKIYPNPTDGIITIDMGINQPNIVVEIRDITGKLVESKSYRNTQLIEIEIMGAPGVYMLYLSSGDKKAVMKVVKE
jgi:hypothetical protein